MRDLTYPPIIRLALGAFKALDQRLVLTGAGHIPRTGGVLLAVNHISYVDFVYGGLAAHPAGRLVRFMAKKEIFDNPVAGPVMRSMHHIPVDRSAGESCLRTALGHLEAGEAVGIFPEATISRALVLKDFKTGAVRIAALAGVPVVPVVLWGTQRIVTKDHPRSLARGRTISVSVGEPLLPTGANPAAETAELRSRMSTLLDTAIQAHPAHEQPAGSWWLPASYGGSAPTLEQAAELDAAERVRRAERHLAKARARASRTSPLTSARRLVRRHPSR